MTVSTWRPSSGRLGFADPVATHAAPPGGCHNRRALFGTLGFADPGVTPCCSWRRRSLTRLVHQIHGFGSCRDDDGGDGSRRCTSTTSGTRAPVRIRDAAIARPRPARPVAHPGGEPAGGAREVGDVAPSARASSSAWSGEAMDAQRSDNRNRVLLGLAAAVAVVAIVVAIVVVTDDDEDPVGSDDTTTTTAADSTTTTKAPRRPPRSRKSIPMSPRTPIPRRRSASTTPSPPRCFPLFCGLRRARRRRVPAGRLANPGRSRSWVRRRRPVRGAPATARGRRLVRHRCHHRLDRADHTTDRRHAHVASGPLEGQAYAFEGTVQVRLYADGCAGAHRRDLRHRSR